LHVAGRILGAFLRLLAKKIAFYTFNDFLSKYFY